MEWSAARAGNGGDLGLLRFQDLGGKHGGSKADPRRSRCVSCVRPGMEQSGGIRLVGSVRQPSADWRNACADIRSGALRGVVRRRTADGWNFERGYQDCARGGQPRLRAAVPPHLYYLCQRQIGAGNPGGSPAALAERRRSGTSRSSGATAEDRTRSAEEMALFMNRISTHVLDTTLGKPANGVLVRLERRETGGEWAVLGSSSTDGSGRCAQLLPENVVLRAGLYRLAFDTESYHLAQKMEGFYPVVEITFLVKEGESHVHVPLLLSPHGYTTYRGS